MSRQIKFRGKASNMLYNGADILHHKGDWLYGDLIHQDGKCFIAPVDKRHPYGTSFLSFVVDPDTVGQYTGLKDRNGVDIYEGDIVKYKEIDGYKAEHIGEVVFKNCSFVISYHYWRDKYNTIRLTCETKSEIKDPQYTVPYTFYFEVTGNIHDNPELLTNKK